MPPAEATLAAIVNLNGTGTYLEVGNYQISLANLVVIVLMVLAFILALVVPFPRDRGDK